jgi:hypothetical protein
MRRTIKTQGAETQIKLASTRSGVQLSVYRGRLQTNRAIGIPVEHLDAVIEALREAKSASGR